MRIRTIKPEFWTHPVLARKDDATKLLAIGLLNYSDDEGYFLADPSLVRGALRAFDDDSTITRRALDTLLKIDYIQVSHHPTHGDIGRVVSFRSHQRIDRPNPSKLAHLFDSTSPRRVLDEHSSTEQGTGNREQGEEGKESAPALESYAEIPSWDEFWTYCQGPQCNLTAEWFARDKFLAAESANWERNQNWRAYARRCQKWWESDGRPSEPPQKKGQQQTKPKAKFLL